MPRQVPLPLGFDPQQGFDEFYPGINAEVVSHLLTFVRAPTEPFIYLWGDTATGKTHLLNACCRESHHSGLNSAYLPLVSLSQYGHEALDGLEQLDLVAIDDIDHVSGNPAWEHALFQLFNRLRDSGHRLIVGAGQPPNGLSVHLPDLTTRLQWGLTLRLRQLGDDDMLQALTLQARTLGLDLAPPVAKFLLSHTRRDLAALRQLLERLDTATLAAQRRLTIPFLKSYLEETP